MSSDVERGWIVRIEDEGVSQVLCRYFAILGGGTFPAPPNLAELRYPPPLHRHRRKGAGPSEEPASHEPSEVDTDVLFARPARLVDEGRHLLRP